MRKIMILLAIIVVGMLIPVGFSTNDSQVVITYGETTYNNANYKNTVDTFFENNAGGNLKNIDSKIITASDVNKISGSITGKTYSSDQVFSSALVNLKENDNLEVSVDKSKITTITGDMYISALKSSGITAGHVYVTSPVEATGESALAGIMNSSNNEIYTQAESVKNSDVDAEKLSDLVDDVKEEVKVNNVTDHSTIVNIINNYTVTNNINITNSDIENLATSIEQTQNVQGDVNTYQSEVSGIMNGTNASEPKGLLDGFFN